MGNIQTGEGVLAASRVPGVLGKGQRRSTGSGAEDFAYVIECTAVGVSSAHAQLFEKIVGAKFSLQSVVIREAAIVALQHQAFRAIGTAQRGISRLSGAKQHLRTGADSQPGRRGRVTGHNGIAIYGLEEVVSVVAYIAQLNG